MNEEDFALFVQAYRGEVLTPSTRNVLYKLLGEGPVAHPSPSRMSPGVVKTLEELLTLEQRVFLKLTS